MGQLQNRAQTATVGSRSERHRLNCCLSQAGR